MDRSARSLKISNIKDRLETLEDKVSREGEHLYNTLYQEVVDLLNDIEESVDDTVENLHVRYNDLMEDLDELTEMVTASGQDIIEEIKTEIDIIVETIDETITGGWRLAVDWAKTHVIEIAAILSIIAILLILALA